MDNLTVTNTLIACSIVTVLAFTAFKLRDIYIPILLAISMRREYSPTLEKSPLNGFILTMLWGQSLRFTIISIAEIFLISASQPRVTKAAAAGKLLIVALIAFVFIVEWNQWAWDGGYPAEMARWAIDAVQGGVDVQGGAEGSS